MDSMTYNYYSNSNKLSHVDDAVSAANYTTDIDDQVIANYDYDEIGNLIKDSAEGIANNGIVWNVYGKIASITKTVNDITTSIFYTYDASGNRIGKRVHKDDLGITQTWYVRDASGNVMAVYENNNGAVNNGMLTQTEIHLYGSSRLGLWKAEREVQTNNWWLFTSTAMPGTSNGGYTGIYTRGKTVFELSNHLGNVLVTISDRKLQVSDNGQPAMVNYYTADVLTANDYYPFGSLMPGRKFSADGLYRYGFNGKEKENSIGNDSYDFGARIYDGRIGKWLSVDPLFDKYPDLGPYVAFNNNPVYFVDPDGRDVHPNGIKNTAYWDTYQSLLTNPTAKSILQKFENNKDFNLTLREGTFPATAVTDAHHGVSSRKVYRSTGKVALQNSFIEFNLKRTKIEVTKTFNEVEYNYTKTMTDFYKFSTTLHELIHAKIGYADTKKNDLEAGNNHNYFANNYYNTLVKGLTEYAKSNNLDVKEQEIKETAFVGLKKTDLFKKYIQGLADNNKTTVEQEEEAYEKRISVIVWKTTAVRASDNKLVIDGAESDKFNVKKEK